MTSTVTPRMATTTPNAMTAPLLPSPPAPGPPSRSGVLGGGSGSPLAARTATMGVSITKMPNCADAAALLKSAELRLSAMLSAPSASRTTTWKVTVLLVAPSERLSVSITSEPSTPASVAIDAFISACRARVSSAAAAVASMTTLTRGNGGDGGGWIGGGIGTGGRGGVGLGGGRGGGGGSAPPGAIGGGGEGGWGGMGGYATTRRPFTKCAWMFAPTYGEGKGDASTSAFEHNGSRNQPTWRPPPV
mmetsp:Transcript_70215/g.186738  ORF Transcript_70215/g.186738 Transcript_70215/m.186738 type:complete len:247 (-) Transcript_70215:274-1014(-)